MSWRAFMKAKNWATWVLPSVMGDSIGEVAEGPPQSAAPTVLLPAQMLPVRRVRPGLDAALLDVVRVGLPLRLVDVLNTAGRAVKHHVDHDREHHPVAGVLRGDVGVTVAIDLGEAHPLVLDFIDARGCHCVVGVVAEAVPGLERADGYGSRLPGAVSLLGVVHVGSFWMRTPIRASTCLVASLWSMTAPFWLPPTPPVSSLTGSLSMVTPWASMLRMSSMWASPPPARRWLTRS